MKFVTDFTANRPPGEPCVLEGNDMKVLHVKSMEGHLLLALAPVEPWTPEKLRETDIELFIGSQALQEGANAYLGDVWVGSTEI